jgi:hypothetical protein
MGAKLAWPQNARRPTPPRHPGSRRLGYGRGMSHGSPRGSTPGRLRIVAAATAFLLASPVQAAIVTPTQPPAQAVERFDAGQAAYARGAYTDAARLWQESLQQLPDDGFGLARANLLLDISTAHERAFDATGDAESLERARTFLSAYAEAIDQAHADDEARAREQARVRDRQARLAGKSQPAQALEPAAPYLPPSGPKGAPMADSSTKAKPRDRARAKHRGMIAGGTILTLAGVGGLGMLAVGVLNDNKPLSISGAVVALAGGIVGPVMIIFAVRRRKSALSSSQTTMRFIGTPTMAGLSMAGRF